MGTLVLIALSLFSCKKDKEIQPIKNPETTVITPATDKTITTGPEIIQNNLVGEKEVREVIKVTELLHKLIKESLTQLLYNHDFNLLMPQVDTRENCETGSCNEGRPNCGCPYQSIASSSNASTYPKVVTLQYFDPDNVTECACELPTVNSSGIGLKVEGEMDIRFSGSFLDNDIYITLYPDDNFTVDGYDIDADSIRIQSVGSATGSEVSYALVNIEKVRVTKDGETTEAYYIGTPTNPLDPTALSGPSTNGNKSTLILTDVNNNHGSPTALAFGLLDDITELTLVNLSLECANGQRVRANSVADEPIIYDMACDNIQDGIVNLVQGRRSTLVATYDYGASLPGTPHGTCDDEIEIDIVSN